MVSANGAPTGYPAMAAAEWVPPPLWSSSPPPQVYTRIARAGQISVSRNVLENDFFFTIKKKFLEKNTNHAGTVPSYTVARPQSLPSNMLYTVGRLHNTGTVLKCIIIQYIYT